jgi:hypothetical protein
MTDISKVLVFPLTTVSLEQFEETFKPLYGFYFPLAKHLFLEYGALLSISCASIMLYAHDAEKRKACLRKMKKQIEVVSFCHPDLRKHPIFLQHPAYVATQRFFKELFKDFGPTLIPKAA